MKILFLDMDGVCNSHKILKDAGCCGIDRKCIRHLNRVVRETDCRIVLSSAWRYIIHGGAMNYDGFFYLLRTHGFTNGGRGNPIIGVTRKDKDPGRDERGEQIRAWLRRPGNPRAKTYCAIDDCDIGITEAGIPLVLTNGEVGMTAADADLAIGTLNGTNGASNGR